VSTTFAAFITLIQNEINDIDASMKTRIEGWTNDRHHEICSSRKWNWLEAVSDSTAIAANPLDITTGLKVATVTTEARNVLDILDASASPYQPLYPTTVDAVRASYQNWSAYTGTPTHWYLQGGTKLFLFPAPAASRNYTIRFTKAAQSYTTGSTAVLLIPDRWVEMLKEAVLAKAKRWQDKPQEMALHEQYFQNALARAKAQDGEEAPIIYNQKTYPFSILPKASV
jgi:hypothetical protein